MTRDGGGGERRDMAGEVVLPPPSPEVRIFRLDLDFAESSLKTHISAQVHRTSVTFHPREKHRQQ